MPTIFWVWLLLIILRVASEHNIKIKKPKLSWLPKLRQKTKVLRRRAVLRRLYKNQFRYAYFSNVDSRDFAWRVRRFYREIEADVHEDHRFIYYLLRSMVSQDHVILALLSRWNASYVNMLRPLYYWYQKEGQNPISNWKGKKVDNYWNFVCAMLDYLFPGYKVPVLINDIWHGWYYDDAKDFTAFFAGEEERKKLEQLEPDNFMFRLYFHLKKGRSLRDFSNLKEKMSKRTAGFLVQTDERTFHNAYWMALFKSEGGQKERADFLFSINMEYANAAFWKGFFRVVAQAEKEACDTQELIMLVELLQLMKFNNEDPIGCSGPIVKELAGSMPNFTLRKRGLVALKRKLFRIAPFKYRSIEGMQDSYTFVGKDEQVYQIIRLQSRGELVAEGDALEHCVGSRDYHWSCWSGESSIWSMRALEKDGNFKRLITMEIHQKELVEIGGYENRYPDEAEKAIIIQWLELIAAKLGVNI